MEHPAGELDNGPLRVGFDRRLTLEFNGSRITLDAGLLAYRKLDDALGLTDLAGAALSECRRGKNTRHLLTGLFRQSVFGRLAGYEDVNGAERLAHDPAMRAVVDRSGFCRRSSCGLAGVALGVGSLQNGPEVVMVLVPWSDEPVIWRMSANTDGAAVLAVGLRATRYSGAFSNAAAERHPLLPPV
jgi:hypothetical protein